MLLLLVTRCMGDDDGGCGVNVAAAAGEGLDGVGAVFPNDDDDDDFFLRFFLPSPLPMYRQNSNRDRGDETVQGAPNDVVVVDVVAVARLSPPPPPPPRVDNILPTNQEWC